MASTKSFFDVNLHRKNKTVGISVFSCKSWFSKMLLGFFGEGKRNSRIETSNAGDILFQFLDNASCLKPRNSKQLKTSPTSGQFFEARQNSNRNFCIVSDLDTTNLSPVSFWMENFTFQTLKQNSFQEENLLEKNIFSIKTSEIKSDFETAFTTLQNAN